MVAILTYITEDTQVDFCARAMRNIDDQSIRNWHHFILCETEGVMHRIQSLLSLRSSTYSEQTTVLLDRNLASDTKDFEYLAIHPVRDTWSPSFLEIMIAKMESAPVFISGVWAQYTIVHEVVRNKTISIDSSEPGPRYTEALLTPSFEDIEKACHIQGMYYTHLLPEESPIHHIHPVQLAAYLVVQSDILTIPETRASHSIVEVEDNALQFQQLRNQIYRTYPLLRGCSR